MSLPLSEINYLAVLVGAVVFMVVGFVWYARPVFGTTWARLIGMSEEQMSGGAGIGFLWTFIGSLVASFVLALVIIAIGGTTFVDGLMAGVLIGVGLVSTAMLSNAIFEGKHLGAWLITSGYQVVTLGIVGGILAIWH